MVGDMYFCWTDKRWFPTIYNTDDVLQDMTDRLTCGSLLQQQDHSLLCGLPTKHIQSASAIHVETCGEDSSSSFKDVRRFVQRCLHLSIDVWQKTSLSHHADERVFGIHIRVVRGLVFPDTTTPAPTLVRFFSFIKLF
jgi:hypothetical protein